MYRMNPPKTTIKPFDPISQERQMADLRRTVTPGEGPMARPNQMMHVSPIQIPSGNPQAGAFMKLRAMLGGK